MSKQPTEKVKQRDPSEAVAALVVFHCHATDISIHGGTTQRDDTSVGSEGAAGFGGNVE